MVRMQIPQLQGCLNLACASTVARESIWGNDRALNRFPISIFKREHRKRPKVLLPGLFPHVGRRIARNGPICLSCYPRQGICQGMVFPCFVRIAQVTHHLAQGP